MTRPSKFDTMGPRARGVYEYMRLAAARLDADPESPRDVRMENAIMYGFTLALALQQMDPDWTRSALDQLDEWGERTHGDSTIPRARQELIAHTGQVRRLARQFGDA
jgi:hypothetical protein